MKFDWDRHKREQNIVKHGIDFADIPEMFESPMLVQLDMRNDYGEDRWIGIGLLRMTVAAVVYVEWEDEDIIRIISARKATRNENKAFHKRFTN